MNWSHYIYFKIYYLKTDTATLVQFLDLKFIFFSQKKAPFIGVTLLKVLSTTQERITCTCIFSHITRRSVFALKVNHKLFIVWQQLDCIQNPVNGSTQQILTRWLSVNTIYFHSLKWFRSPLTIFNWILYKLKKTSHITRRRAASLYIIIKILSLV